MLEQPWGNSRLKKSEWVTGSFLLGLGMFAIISLADLAGPVFGSPSLAPLQPTATTDCFLQCCIASWTGAREP